MFYSWLYTAGDAKRYKSRFIFSGNGLRTEFIGKIYSVDLNEEEILSGKENELVALSPSLLNNYLVREDSSDDSEYSMRIEFRLEKI